MINIKNVGLVIAKEIYNIAIFVFKLALFLAAAMPIIMIWLYIIMTSDGIQLNEISLSQFIVNSNIQYFSFLIATSMYGIYRLCDFKNKSKAFVGSASHLTKLN